MTLKTTIDADNTTHIDAAELLTEFVEDFFQVKNLALTVEETLEFEMDGLPKTFGELGQLLVDTAIKLQARYPEEHSCTGNSN